MKILNAILAKPVKFWKFTIYDSKHGTIGPMGVMGNAIPNGETVPIVSVVPPWYKLRERLAYNDVVERAKTGIITMEEYLKYFK